MGSAYFHDTIGIDAKPSRDLLETMAFTINSLKGPWILGADWNCTPAELQATNWLQKVRGVVCAPKAATCNGKVKDLFVVSASIAEAVQSVHVVADAGFYPHSPVRLCFKGVPRVAWVRQVEMPISIPAVLPYGPPNEQQHQLDQSQQQIIQHTGGVDQQFVDLTRLTEDHLFATMGVEQSSVDNSQRREHGIRFKWMNAASPAADQTARSTPVSRSWRRVVAWLREVKAGRTHSLVQSAI